MDTPRPFAPRREPLDHADRAGADQAGDDHDSADHDSADRFGDDHDMHDDRDRHDDQDSHDGAHRYRPDHDRPDHDRADHFGDDHESDAVRDTATDSGGRHRVKVPEPTPLTEHGPARIIAVANQKGGVGKTTSTINLGAALAEYGRRVLLVDFDPQGALSIGLGVQAHELDTTIYNLLMERGVEVEDVIRPTGVENLELLPSNIDLSAAEVQLVTEVGREQALGRAIKPVLDRYDVVLIDCQPSLGLLTINALACADEILIPLACEFFSLRGVALLMDTIEKVQDRLNPDLRILGILATMFDPRTLHTREVRQRVIEAFGELVFESVINRTVRFPETTVAGEPITTWAPTSNGAEAYRLLAREVIAR